MKKKLLCLLGFGVAFLTGAVVGYVVAEDEYNGYMNSMFEDEEEEDDGGYDEEIDHDFDRNEVNARDKEEETES